MDENKKISWKEIVTAFINFCNNTHPEGFPRIDENTQIGLLSATLVKYMFYDPEKGVFEIIREGVKRQDRKNDL